MEKVDNKTIISISSANFFDSAATVSIGLALPIWILAFGLNGIDVGIIGILGPSAFGSALGALIGGICLDKYGRKKILNMGLILFFLGFMCCLFSLNKIWLYLGCFLIGSSSGVVLPASWTLMSEISKAKERSKNLGIAQVARPCGIILMYVIFFILSIVIPIKDSNGNMITAGVYGPFDGTLITRILFLLLGIFSLISLVLVKNVKESKLWQNNKALKKSTESTKALLKNKQTIKNIFILIGVYAPWNIVACTISQYIPTMASTMDVEGTEFALIAFVICVFSIISVSCFPKCIVKFKYRSLYALGSIFAILAIAVITLYAVLYNYFPGTAPWLIYLFAFFWGGNIGFSAQTFYSIWSSELFPTQIRGTIQGIMFFIICFLNGIWVLIAFWIFDATVIEGVIIVCMLMVFLLIISSIVGIIFCPNTQNHDLDSINQTNYKAINN